MRHNPPEGPKQPLAAVRVFRGPNIVCLSRARKPPVLGKRDEDDEEHSKESQKPAGKGTKRELRGMSRKSALDFARMLSSLDWGKHGLCIHVTVTYHRTYPCSKAALQLAKSWIVKELGLQVECGVWRLEYQSRESETEKAGRLASGIKRERGQGGSIKVPHWHFLLWMGGRDVDRFELWLRKWWGAYASNPHPKAVKITRGDQARGAWYVAMHAAKREQAPLFAVGRWWGYVRRDVLLEAQDLHDTGAIEERERVWWARLYRRATGVRTRSASGFSWFLPRGWQYVVSMWVLERVATERAEKHRAKDPY